MKKTNLKAPTKSNIKLGGIFYPTRDISGRSVPFDSLFIPYIFKEIYLEGVYVDIFNQGKDMTIIDVGAQVGIVTHYMRQFAKKIYALEPSPEHFEALKKNKEYNHWDNVEIFNMALADKNGKMSLNVNPANRTCNSLVLDYSKGAVEVETIRFDTFMEKNKIEKVDFCKFDVEGAEDMILRSKGFQKVAHKIKAIEIEFHFPNWQELVKYMLELGYTARRYESSAVIVLFTRE
jgi:FkbM family methyltransferase